MAATKLLARIFSVLLIVAFLLAGQPARPVAAAGVPRYVAPSGFDLENDCLSRGTPCKTIGYAIGVANPSGDVIRISSGTYYEHLSIGKSLTLVGAGMGATFIDGSNTARVITVPDASDGVDISGLTIQHGNAGATENAGGGIQNYGALTLSHVKVADSVANQAGGGIINFGSLTMTDSIISGNQQTVAGSMGGGGLALESSSPTLLTRVTINNNTASDMGGGIANVNGGVLTLTNVTITANQAKYGAGLYNFSSATANFLSSTIVANSVTTGGYTGGVSGSGTISFINTIIANNLANNCAMSGTVTDLGYNLDSGNDCGFTNTDDHQNTGDPSLGLLADNGGTTPTMALLTGSPAVDAGTSTSCPATDQRGIPRPQGAHCDIGAFETQAQTGPAFVVNTIVDTDDLSCDVLGQGIGNKDCSLRDAINAANALGGTDTITFSVSGAIGLGATLPDIDNRAALTIDGTGHVLTISGSNAVRIMIVDGGGILSLNNLTIANGSSDAGGAIYNTGTLSITNSTFSGNNAAGTGIGGGIYNSGTLTIANSTFSGNNSGDYGGSIYNTGTLAVTNGTFSANSALVGGGIFNSGTATLRNTIVANSSSGGNCGGTITNAGNNLDSGTTCGWGSTAGSISNTDPLLGALTNNGGPTQTFALLPGSPAIDAGNNIVCAAGPVNALDQRGLVRPYGAACDIGSFERWQYALSGNVGVTGATLTYTGGTTTSGTGGSYSITVPYNWNGVVTPSKAGYTFSPPNRDYSTTPVTADQGGQDFSATLNTYVISGNIGMDGVTLAYTGGTTTTIGGGNYSITVPYGWNGIITPSKVGYTFSPPNRDYSATPITADLAGQGFSATLNNYIISGNTGMDGVTLAYTGGTTTTIGGGNYSITVPYGWNGIITPSKVGYTFSPPNRDYSATPITADLAGQGFSATLNTYVISGKAGDSGVLLTYPGGTTTSDGGGYYSISVPYGWNGSVTPSKSGLAFTPASYNYTNVITDQANQDYAATASFISTGGQDGWVLESSEKSNKGGTLNSKAKTFFLGDNAARKQYRGILSFSTGAALPDGAVITRVTLILKKSSIAGGSNPLNIFKGLMLDIKDGFFGSTSTLQASDFQAAASKSYGPFKPALVGGLYTIDLTAASGTINTLATGSGLTQIRLRFKWDDNNNAVANTLSLFSGNAPAPNRPQLIITYHLP